MKLSCPYCSREIPAADINISLAVAKCAGCDQVFNFAGQMGLTTPTAETKRAVPLPPRFNVEELGGDLTIRWTWYSHAVWFLLLFCIVWDGFLVFWYSMAFFGSKEMGSGAILMMLFPMLHVAVGVGLTYFVLCTFLNRTIVRVSQGELTVRHGPMPWFGNHTLSTFDIAQLYCTEKVSNNRRGYNVNYQLNVMRTDDTKLALLTLEELDQALYLEQKLEAFLKIEDERIPGEVRV